MAREGGVELTCRTLGCSRRSLYRWLRAFDAEGVAGLASESRRPLRPRVTIVAVPNLIRNFD
jgi:transposase-like protein